MHQRRHIRNLCPRIIYSLTELRNGGGVVKNFYSTNKKLLSPFEDKKKKKISFIK